MFEPLTPLPGFEAPEEWAVIFTFAFMALDIVVGTVCAFAANKYESSKVREGLMHKAMIALVIVLAIFIQLASSVIGDLGFGLPTIMPVCSVIILMEVGSCIESIGAAYPELSETGIFKIFNKKGEK